MAYPYNYQNFMGNYQTYANNSQNYANQNNSMIWVQGEAGAKAYLVAPNSTVQLWDSESPTIYLKSADATGMPTIKILDYVERNALQNSNENERIKQNEVFATKEDISVLKKEINEIKSKMKPVKKTIKKGEEDE